MELARISQLSLFFSYDKLKGKYRRQQYFLCPSPQIAMAKPCDPFSSFYTVPPKKKKKIIKIQGGLLDLPLVTV